MGDLYLATLSQGLAPIDGTALPSLSVVMANYNHGRFLAESVGAILRQSYRACQLIVVDDGSTDDSLQILEAFARDDASVQVLRNDRNQGVMASFARGLDRAQGEYVYFAAADDRVLPGFFERSMRLLARYPAAGVCSCLAVIVDDSGHERGLAHSPVVSRGDCFLPPREALRTLRSYGPWIQGTTAICRRRALLEVGPEIPELESYSDSFIDLVLAAKYGACFIPEPLAIWRRLDASYATRITADPDRSMAIVRRAADLMETRYKGLFPAGAADEWLNYQRYSIALAAYARFQAHRQHRPRPGQQALFKFQDVVVKAYLFSRFRRLTVAVVGQALRPPLPSRKT